MFLDLLDLRLTVLDLPILIFQVLAGVRHVLDGLIVGFLFSGNNLVALFPGGSLHLGFFLLRLLDLLFFLGDLLINPADVVIHRRDHVALHFYL